MIYFDNAATSYPKPDRVYQGVLEAMRDYGANPGRSGHKLSLEMARDIYKARNLIKDLIGADDPRNIIFTSNGTESLNLGIKGLVKEGDHVITSNIEHNSVIRPLVAMEKKGLIELSIIDASRGYVDPQILEGEIKENTSLLAINHMSNVMGALVNIGDLGEVARKNDIYFLVDGAQSLGVYEIDVEEMGIDLLAFPGHKGLMGPQGTGGLYIRPGIDLETLKLGGTGSISESLDQPDFLPDKYESGTLNGPGIVGLARGIEYINKLGLEKIRSKEQELTKRFIDGIRDIDSLKVYGPQDGFQGPVVSINLGEMGSSDLAYILDEEYNIAVRSGLHCAPLIHKAMGTIDQGTVRFSFGYMNSDKEIDQAIRALKEISKSQI